ncbi:MAG: addiction module antitoxin RelB [Acidobacteria bacterium RIFCSPLOWO2_12_FULL_60_22]|nr:MAG: addiction module antitoxin RelB [Acidobacteria bacterium RIFCSPLOWO2_12_FULL_60_22]
MTLKELEAEALKLNPNSRAKLATKLLSSLEVLSDAEIERLWNEEALRRNEELEKGKATARPAQDVIRDARARAS